MLWLIFSVSILVFLYLRNVCHIVIFIECFKLLVSQNNSVCVCVCACVRACVCVCVCTLLLLNILAFVFECVFVFSSVFY